MKPKRIMPNVIKNIPVIWIAVPSDRPNAFAIKTPKALPSKERSLIRKRGIVAEKYINGTRKT